MVLNRSSRVFRMRQTVVRELSEKPYVGFEKDDDLPDGWLYDIKRWCSPFDLLVPTMPRLADPSTQGLSRTDYFKSGVGDVALGDLRVEGISERVIDMTKGWVPILNNGTYYNYDTGFFYYGDNSVIQYVDPTLNRSSRNYLELSAVPDTKAPILAASFKRDPSTGEIRYRTKIQQVYKFSGVYVDGEEQPTFSEAGQIYWSNVDFDKREFLVDNVSIDGLTRLWFNRDFVEQIGSVPRTGVYKDLAACEHIGNGKSSYHEIEYENGMYVFTGAYFLKNFPVLLDESGYEFKLYVGNPTAQTFEEWTRVDSWWEMINASNNKRYYVDKDFGIVYVGSQDPNLLPPVNSDIVAVYNTTLRIEYEELDSSILVSAEKANVNPIAQSVNQGFVCITHERLDPDSITLTIDKPVINGTSDPVLYGPITTGSDFAILTANVKSVKGTNLPNIPVSFFMDPVFGTLNDGSTAQAITNQNGNAYAIYQPPTSGDDLGYYSTIVRDSTNVAYPVGTYKEIVIQTTDDIGWSGAEEDIYLFQILKDDIILGYKTIDDYLLSVYQEETPAWVMDATTYARWKTEMIEKYDLKDFQDEPIESGQKIYGRKVVVYQIDGVDNTDATAIHPVTGEVGGVDPRLEPTAVMPVRPEVVERDGDGYWRVIYEDGAIPDCGESEEIAGYWLVSSKIVEFQATCWSEFHNHEIRSNTVNTRVGLPEYMLGVYVNGLGENIPFGWKLTSEDGSMDSIASGLNGATFITVNPFIGPYPILDLVGGTGETGERASAPFRTVGFQFSVEEE